MIGTGGMRESREFVQLARVDAAAADDDDDDDESIQHILEQATRGIGLCWDKTTIQDSWNPFDK